MIRPYDCTLSDACRRGHRHLIYGRCPWCNRTIAYGCAIIDRPFWSGLHDRGETVARPTPKPVQFYIRSIMICIAVTALLFALPQWGLRALLSFLAPWLGEAMCMAAFVALVYMLSFGGDEEPQHSRRQDGRLTI